MANDFNDYLNEQRDVFFTEYQRYESFLDFVLNNKVEDL